MPPHISQHCQHLWPSSPNQWLSIVTGELYANPTLPTQQQTLETTSLTSMAEEGVELGLRMEAGFWLGAGVGVAPPDILPGKTLQL